MKKLAIIIALMLFLMPYYAYGETVVAASCNNGAAGTQLAPALTTADFASNWTADAGWTSADDKLTGTEGGSGYIYLTAKSGNIVAGTTYILTVVVDSSSAGAYYLYAKVGGTNSAVFAGVGTHRLTISNVTNTDKLKISMYNMTAVISSITLYELKNDVQTAVDSASDGDTITIPAGTCNFDSTVYIPNTKGLTITGAGAGTTNITHTVEAFHIYANEGKVNSISGMTFTSTGDYAVVVNGYSPSGTYCLGSSLCENIINIHENTFNHSGITVRGRITGVIWSNTFNHTVSYTTISVFEEPNDLSGGDGGSASFTRDTDWGTNKFIYIEGNSFNIDSVAPGSGLCDSRSGGRYVLRYNSVKGLMHGHHAAQTAYERGTRAFEVYNNLWFYTTNTQAAIYNIRSGTGVIYNNRFKTHGFTFGPITIQETRYPSGYSTDREPWKYACGDSTATKFCLGGSAKSCTTVDDCTGSRNGFSFTGPCVYMDTNVSGELPCRDMIGTGVVNATTGVMASEPMLAWNNKSCTAAGGDCDPDSGSLIGLYESTPSPFTRNVHYCDKTCSGDGTTPCAADGDCSEAGGTCTYSATKPASCNGVNNSYAAYTSCPHPLADPEGDYECDSTLYGTGGYYIPKKGSTSWNVTPSAGAGCDLYEWFQGKIENGETATFSMTPSYGYTGITTGGTCGGSLVDTTYTTNAITADCTVTCAGAGLHYITQGSGGSATLGSGGTITLGN